MFILSRFSVNGFVVALLLVTAVTVLGPIASVLGQTAEIPQVVIVQDADGVITVPAEIPTGLVTVVFTNDSEELPFSPFLARLNDDITVDTFMAALSGGPLAALPLVSLLGGVGAEPGTSAAITYDVTAGQYVLLNLDGEAPQILPFAAVEAPKDPYAAELTAPEADVTITLVDFAFGMPLEIAAGPQVWQFLNKGTQWHEMGIIRMEEGMTQEDLMAQLMQILAPPAEGEPAEEDGPPDVPAVFFWTPMSAGKEAWIELDLEPGTYVALCFLPDFESGTSHLEHGMLQMFTVTEVE